MGLQPAGFEPSAGILLSLWRADLSDRSGCCTSHSPFPWIAKRLNAQIAGEALFNDGIGIVLFLSLLSMTRGESGHLKDVLFLFFSETGGGLAFGALLGWVGYRLMKSVDDYQLEILISRALVSGGYSLARAMGISGPLAMVATGLLIGGPGRRLAMSERTRKNLDRFWELIEEMLNSILFTLLGLEVLAVITRLDSTYLIIASLAIPLVLLGRLLSVCSISFLLTTCGNPASRRVRIMTWSGLRGGIAIALALSVPEVSERGPLLFATYVVVAFSILVQGTTLKYLVASRHK